MTCTCIMDLDRIESKNKIILQGKDLFLALYMKKNHSSLAKLEGSVKLHMLTLWNIILQRVMEYPFNI